MAASSLQSLPADIVEKLFRFIENSEKLKPPGDPKKVVDSKIIQPNTDGHSFNAIVTLSHTLDAAVIFDTLPSASTQLEKFRDVVKDAQFAYIPERANKRSTYMAGFTTYSVPIRSSVSTTLPSQPMPKELVHFCSELLTNLHDHVPQASVLKKQVWNAADIYEPVLATVEFIVAENVDEAHTKHNGIMNFSQLDFIEPEHAGDTDLSAVLLLGQPRIFDVKPVFTAKDSASYPSYSLSSGSILYLLGKNVRYYYACSVKPTSANIGSSCLVTVRFRPKPGVASQALLRADIKKLSVNTKNPLIFRKLADEPAPTFSVVHQGAAQDHVDTYTLDDLDTTDDSSKLPTEELHKFDMRTRRMLANRLLPDDKKNTADSEALAKKIPLEVIVNSKESTLTGIYPFASIGDKIDNLPEVLSALYQVHHVELGTTKGSDVQTFDADVLPERIFLVADVQKRQTPVRRRSSSSSSSSSTQQSSDPTPEHFVFLGVDYYVDRGDC